MTTAPGLAGVTSVPPFNSVVVTLSVFSGFEVVAAGSTFLGAGLIMIDFEVTFFGGSVEVWSGGGEEAFWALGLGGITGGVSDDLAGC